MPAISLAKAPQPASTNPAQIRNFCIIAHIDHGKSTLADRMLGITEVVEARNMRAQYLDRMDIERERGITIKSQAVRLPWRSGIDGGEYILNMIDTPGHVDFTYEVSRSLAACEGAVLLVDCAQGIEAQTLANLYLAMENNLTIIPVLNKIDLPNAQPEKFAAELARLIGCQPEDCLRVSGKTGDGVAELLDQIVAQIPAPVGDPDAPARALIFDSVYDSYRGVVTYVRVVDGHLSPREQIQMFSTGVRHEALEVGVISPEPLAGKGLGVGEVGYLITGVKDVRQSRVGDTITTYNNPTKKALAGYKDPKPMVFSGLFPLDGADFPILREALDKLQLNDAALVYEPESSAALGFGFRCGFLGLLHMEIIQERLEREFNQTVITTVPNVSFEATTVKGEKIIVNNPTEMPDPTRIEVILEPFIRAQIITKPEYIGNIMNLCIGKRGMLTNQSYLSPTRIELSFEMPLTEIVIDFYDKLKSQTRGYASFDYHPIDMRPSDIVKMDILLNGEKVDALSALIHRSRAQHFGSKLCEKLKELLPKQQFQIAIQAAIGAKVISRENISAMRKDVTAKCYGGDISRKRKLLEKQKEGKKRMKQIGNVEVPQEAFLAVLKLDD